MSRSGCIDDGDIEQWDLIRWRGAVASALRCRRGQAFLREMLAALYALPEKRLLQNDLVDEYDDGAVCALGSVGRARKVDMQQIDPEDHEGVAAEFDIAHALACEIMWINDEGAWKETAAQRWLRVRHWVVDHIIDETNHTAERAA